MNVTRRNVEVIFLLSISALFFLEAFVGISDAFPDGWFHLTLGGILLISAAVMYLNRGADDKQ